MSRVSTVFLNNDGETVLQIIILIISGFLIAPLGLYFWPFLNEEETIKCLRQKKDYKLISYRKISPTTITTQRKDVIDFVLERWRCEKFVATK